MGFWWVNHEGTYKEEVDGGYIWSPKQNRDATRNQTYLNLRRTQVGDTVFSYAKGEIRSVGVVTGRFREAVKPTNFGRVGLQWDKDGWLVPIDWPLYPPQHLHFTRSVNLGGARQRRLQQFGIRIRRRRRQTRPPSCQVRTSILAKLKGQQGPRHL
jgi:hypothetical protein